MTHRRDRARAELADGRLNGADGAAGSYEKRRGGRSRARLIYKRLTKKFARAEIALVSATDFELLVATILSAQCTDKRVNRVTPALFARYKSVADYARADRDELSGYIASTGFYQMKARAIIESARMIESEFAGEVPDTIDQLLRLRGVGRKTANVVLGALFGKAEGIVVDTHVARLSRRFGLTRSTSPVAIERDLMKIIPRVDWIGFSHRLILFGREVCRARAPRCLDCPIEGLCRWPGKRTRLSRSKKSAMKEKFL